MIKSVVLITKNKVRRNRTYGTSLPDKFFLDTADFMHSTKMDTLWMDIAVLNESERKTNYDLLRY